MLYTVTLSERTKRALWALLFGALAAIGVWATSHTVHEPTINDWLGVVGGYVTAAAYIVLVMSLVFLFERIVLPKRDFFDEILEENNKALAILLGLALLAFAVAASGVSAQATSENRTNEQVERGEGVWAKTRCFRPGTQMPIIAFVPPIDADRYAAVDTAWAWTGSKEQPPGSNSGPAVDQFLSAVGLGGGYPWCAAFLSFCYDQAEVEGPRSDNGDVIRSAGAVDFSGGRRSIEPDAVRRGHRIVPEGSAVVWKRRGTWRGHIGIVREPWAGRCGQTIEGNTRPG